MLLKVVGKIRHMVMEIHIDYQAHCDSKYDFLFTILAFCFPNPHPHVGMCWRGMVCMFVSMGVCTCVCGDTCALAEHATFIFLFPLLPTFIFGHKVFL